MGDIQAHRAETVRDQDAELAILSGSLDILSAYFRDVEHPHPCVLQQLYWCLLGQGDAHQTLKFKRRNGRPSKLTTQHALTAEDAAIEAFDTGDTSALAAYLAGEIVGSSVRLLLAEAFNAQGSTIQKLAFVRTRAGRPDTPLRTDLKTAHLGHTALDLYEQVGNWDGVRDEMERQGLVGQDDTTRKRAVAFVRKAASKPQE